SASRSVFGTGEELLAQRGIAVTSEPVRQWCLTFGRSSADELRRRRPRCGDKWHLDEVFLTIGGQRQSLWPAVDQDGNVLAILVQSQRNKKAAQRFVRKLLKGVHDVARVIITDRLKRYGAAKREILPGVEHRQHKGLNNRAENAHQPTRATLSFCIWSSLQPFPTTKTPFACQGIPCHCTGPIPDVEGRNQCTICWLTPEHPQPLVALA